MQENKREDERQHRAHLVDRHDLRDLSELNGAIIGSIALMKAK